MIRKALFPIILILLALVSCSDNLNEILFEDIPKHSHSFTPNTEGAWFCECGKMLEGTDKPYFALIDSSGIPTIYKLETNASLGINVNECLIQYTNTSEARSVYIKTDSACTHSLEIDAPKDEIRHFGKLIALHIKAVSGSSYYEYGQVEDILHGSGSLVIAESSSVDFIDYYGAVDNSSVVIDGQVGLIAFKEESAKENIDGIDKVEDARLQPDSIIARAGDVLACSFEEVCGLSEYSRLLRDITIDQDHIISEGTTWEILPWAKLSINQNKTLTVDGTLVNNGSVANAGKVIINGKILNNGEWIGNNYEYPEHAHKWNQAENGDHYCEICEEKHSPEWLDNQGVPCDCGQSPIEHYKYFCTVCNTWYIGDVGYVEIGSTPIFTVAFKNQGIIHGDFQVTKEREKTVLEFLPTPGSSSKNLNYCWSIDYSGETQFLEESNSKYVFNYIGKPSGKYWIKLSVSGWMIGSVSYEAEINL